MKKKYIIGIPVRAAVTALLNAAHPDVDFPMTVEEITAQTENALAGQDRWEMLLLQKLFNELNKRNCPL
ncbi:hypothetical protein JW935_04405 [candidate division KSB1 bacterium]|nr:hypothetical protein [candidate division KSB1 bacterium]